MREDEVFLDAPNRGIFFNHIFTGGFELVSSFDEIPVFTCGGSPFLRWSWNGGFLFPEHLFERVQKGSGIALQHEAFEKIGKTEEIPKETLLLPKGEAREARNVFFEEDKEPLFQKFANLETTEEIQSFAGEYGCLRKTPEAWIDKHGNRIGLLESVETWKREIDALNIALRAIVTYEEGRTSDFEYMPDNANHIYIRPALKSGKTSTFLLAPYVKGVPEKTIFKMAIARLFNEKLRESPSVPAYTFVVEKGRFEPCLHPQSLAAAIWLQLAQSFFKDGPAERIAERCYLCGKWGKAYKEWSGTIKLDTDVWSQRKKGPYAGLYYHKLCDKAVRMRENRKRKAEEEGKKLRKRKRTKKLLTEQTITT
jgi:hypothetical protein